MSRFINEQAHYDESSKRLKAKANKEISARSLQSAYDEDATYRTKGKHSQSGFVLNISETCSGDNPIQLITDYRVDQNVRSDVDIIKERIPVIKENTGCESLTTHGGYYADEVMTTGESNDVKLHFTDMTGKTPSPKQVVTAFEIDPETNIIKKCPEGFAPTNAAIKKGQSVAHFPVDVRSKCQWQGQCRVKPQKKSYVVRINKEAITAARQRINIQNEHKLNISVRAAIEGTNSALKRGQGLKKTKSTRPGKMYCSGWIKSNCS